MTVRLYFYRENRESASRGSSRSFASELRASRTDGYHFSALRIAPAQRFIHLLSSLSLLWALTAKITSHCRWQDWRQQSPRPAGNRERVTPLFAALLSIPTGDRYSPLKLSPQQQKDATVAALANHLIGLARDEPLLILFEDTHWIDPTSREVLDLLVDRVQNTSILIIITCRSEFQSSWNAHSHITTLTLNRLSRQLRTTLVERVAGAKKLPKEVIEADHCQDRWSAALCRGAH